MIVLIGSNALQYHTKLGRKTMDIDIVGTYDDVMSYVRYFKNFEIRYDEEYDGKAWQCYPIRSGKKYVIKFNNRIIEAEIAWDNSPARTFVELVKNDPCTMKSTGKIGKKEDILIPSLDVLYMLKMSHRYLKNSPHFLKTMRDIQLMRSLGAKIRYEHRWFFKARERETYAYQHPRLNVSKKDFFNGDGVKYYYEHDTIHLAMAQLDKPAYRFYQPEDSEVNTSKELFFTQPEQIRLYGVLEEAYVLSLERAIIPFGDKVSPKQAFDIALMKVASSITSGWFRAFAWENYDAVQALYSDDYVNRFWKAVEAKIVKLHE